MSLLASRPVQERASVVLPTVTCSSCAAPIPLSALGEHICAPAPPLPSSSIPRAIPRPTQIAIPTPQPAPARTAPRPANLDLGPRSRGGAGSLAPRAPSPLGPALSPRTPSPTNPFFPHPTGAAAPPPANPGLGLGLPASPAAGPSTYARESPPAPGDAMPDTTSGGGAGMAGVGRRAFAAAAWGVRAGVALAASSKGYLQDPDAPGPSSPTAMSPIEREPAAPFSSVQMPMPRPSPTPREPVILPKRPLAHRQRSGTTVAHAAPEHGRRPSLTESPPMVRSATAPGSRPFGSESGSSSDMVRRPSADSAGSRTSADGKPSFFDRYKQMVSSAAAAPSSSLMRKTSGDGAPLVRSPVQLKKALSDYDDLDEGSALPWATPSMGEPEPAEPDAGRHHRQPTAGSSSSSSSSSSRRQDASGSGHETEVVMTPSQSWEGLADRANGVGVHAAHADDARSVASSRRTDAFGTPAYGERGARGLEQIGEEADDDDDDEGERLVFGATPVKRRSGSTAGRGPARGLHPSSSTGTIAPLAAPSPTRPPHVRSRTTPEPARHHAPAPAGRARKTCVKCGCGVGGPAARFVERDGVILCEADWKKMYLPSCRRCALPIEKSAVSSSDGQLKGKWHRACFTCTACDQPFAGDDFYVHDGKPWCQYHYHEANGTLCASATCRQPIEGPCVLTPAPNAQRFHPGHLACSHGAGTSSACREPMDEYYDVGTGRFCERHVADAQRRHRLAGGAAAGRAEKRRTRLVDLPRGGF